VLGISSSGAPRHASSKGREQSRHGAAATPAPSNNPLSAVGKAVESGDSAGSGFVWALLAVAAVLAAAAWMRHRSRSQPS
jgi:hypothetical protein